MDGNEVKEGYLCPICVKDLGNIEELTAHFESTHSSEEKDVLQSLKGLIGRAKRKILKEKDFNESRTDDDDNGPPSNYSSRLTWDYQEIGFTQRHTEAFRSIRSQRVERYVSQTNKLLIRLGKLMSDAPMDPEKRKAHEKAIVPWVQDSDVRLCPGCAKAFNLSRRRHHCRLCGGIMCHMCSQFLDFSFARKLVNPESGRPLLTGSGMRRSSSDSASQPGGGETQLRLCRDCLVLLQRRDMLMEQASSTPALVLMYEKMKGFMDEAEDILPQYYKMVESLSEGETNYTLEEAQMLRVRLTKIAESVDLISRKIGSHMPAEGSPSPRALQLQGGVRLAASVFLRQWLLGLPCPPGPEQLEALQARRRGQLHERLQRDKAAATAQLSMAPQQDVAAAPPPARSTGTPRGENSPASSEGGWSPANMAAAADDPLVQQMSIIRGYIRQAKQTGHLDELGTLEANLKELKQEYMHRTLGSPK